MRKFCFLLLLTLVMVCAAAPGYAQKGDTATDTVAENMQVLTEIAVSPMYEAISLNYLASWSPDGSLLATISENVVQLWDTTTGELAAALALNGANAVAFNADGSLIAVGGRGGNVVVLNVDTWRELGEIAPDDMESAFLETDLLRNALLVNLERPDYIMEMAFSGDSSVLMTSSGLASNWQLWDISEPLDVQAAFEANEPPHAEELTLDMGSSDPFPFALNTTPAGIHALTLENDVLSVQTIVPDVNTGEAQFAADPPQYRFTEAGIVSLSFDGSMLMSIGQERQNVLLVDPTTDTEIRLTVAESDEAINRLSMNANGSLLAVMQNDYEAQRGALDIWDVASGVVLLHWDNPQTFAPISQALFSPDNTKLALIQRNGIQIFALPFERIAPPTPAPAQVESTSAAACDIDMQPTITLLINAQAAAASGDSSTAAQLLTEAQSELAAAQTQCGGEPAPQTDVSSSGIGTGSIALTETFGYSGTAGRMTLSYPEGWIVLEGASGPDLLFIGNSEDALDKDFNQPIPPPFAPGEAVLLIVMGDVVTLFGPNPDLNFAESPDAPALLDAFGRQILDAAQRFGGEDGDELEIGAVTPITIGDHDAAMLPFSTDGFEAAIIFVDLETTGDSQPLYGVAILFTAPGELDVPLAQSVAESFDLVG